MDDIITKEKLEKTVIVSKSGAYVKSDDIAKIFEKQHKVVLKMITNKVKEIEEIHKDLIGTKLCRLISEYFVKSDYLDSKGRTYIRYNLTRKGFDILVLSMTGSKALKYKMWYIDEFHKKTEIIQNDKALAKLHKSDDLYIQFRDESKDIRRLFTEVIQEFELPQRIEEGKDASRFLGIRIMNYTKLVYSILGIEIPKGDNARDVLDIRQLVRLEDLEKQVTKMIKDNAVNGIHYKDSYKMIKKEISK